MKAIKAQCIDFPHPNLLLRLTGSDFHLLLPFHLLLTVSSNCFKHFQPPPAEYTFCAGQHDHTPNEDHGQWPTGLADWGSTFSSLTSWSFKVVGKGICVGRAKSYCSLPYHLEVQMNYVIYIAKMGLYTGCRRSAPCLLQISKSMVKQGFIRSHANPQGCPGFSGISQDLVLFFGNIRPINYFLFAYSVICFFF